MSLSFEDATTKLIKASSTNVEAEAPKPANINVEICAVDDGVGVVSDTSEDKFIRSGKYLWYDSYQDSTISTINKTKNITVDKSQLNLTQEVNSQYIPFRMPRYYDGIDLMSMAIQIHLVNSSNDEFYARPINVQYNEDTIQFGWLVDGHATAIAGEVQFEIIAHGANEMGDEYTWKTCPDGKINILKSLSGNGIIEPSSDWYMQFVAEMDGKIAESAEYLKQVKETVKQVGDAVDIAIEAAGNAQEVVDNASENITQSVLNSVEVELLKFYTKTEVDKIIESIDLSDYLDEINNKIDNIDGLAKFKAIYNATTNTLAFYNGEVLIESFQLNQNPTDEWTTNYTKQIDSKIENKVETVSSALNTYKISNDNRVSSVENKQTVSDSNISSLEETTQTLGSQFDNLKDVVDKINLTPSNVYEATYVDSTFTLYENNEIKNQFQIVGGSGGGGETTVITIERVTPEDSIILLGDSGSIKFNFSSVDNAGDTTGNGSAVWKVGNTTAAKTTVVQGENTFDVTKFLRNGLNTIRLTITDSFGSVSAKTWTITVIEFKLESTFDDFLLYSGDVTFRYTPYGDISKDIIFKLDGNEIASTTVSATGRQMTQTIPSQSHGAHFLEVYMTATVNEQPVRSVSVYKDIIWIDPASSTPVIGCAIQNFSTKQYNTINIPYVVYDPQHNPANITLSENGEIVSNLSVDRTRKVWSFKSSEIGVKNLVIKCGDIEKMITGTIEDLGIDITPVTTNLAFDFNPVGKNNNDTDRLWNNGTNKMDVSDNFDWSNGGYQIDDNGDSYFCVKAGTTATVDYKLFADDAKKTGKNFKLVYKCTNVRDYDAQVLSCYNGGIGFRVFAQNAILNSEQNSISVPYCEDSYMELELNILPDSHFTEMVMWLDGIPSRVELYSSSDSFTQTNAQYITIGSNDCDVWVYRMKSYTMNLTDDEILDNFIADAKNADEMIARYVRNNILDSSGNLDPDLLAEKCPDLRIIKIETPRFTTGKKDKVTTTSFQHIYANGRQARDNWTSLEGVLSGQGTSSEYYGESGRNLDLNCKNGFIYADATTSHKYDMTENSVPVNYFNIKVNIASSENANNACIADDYNTFNPYLRRARINDPRVRDTMEFHPCVVFIKETDLSNAVEFNDGQWHFYASGNIGNSKKNSEAMGMDPDNHKEFIVEVSNNTDDQCRFLSDDLSNEGWDGDTSFEMRYENPNCTEEELQAGKDAWQALLTWVVNATPETFVSEFEDHFIKDSILFFYLFTERHSMVDNRAKNTFWHTEDLIHWDLCFDYDNDTAMGNDNEGGLTLTYGYEDTDTIGTKSVFNASDSKVWCYIRDYMYKDLAELFIRLESKLAWSANRLLEKILDEQDTKPERLWIIDMRRKYFRTYEGNGTTSYLPMMHGSKKHQRKQYETYQEKYIASKYVGATCTSDVITIRGYTPIQWAGVKPDGTFRIVPYADTYIVNRYGSNVTRVRGKRGQTYEIKSPIDAMNDTEVYTYNASLIQSIGNIAPFYPGYCNFNQGVKLTDLIIGSSADGYSNTNMTDFGIGRNILLEHLNLQNLPNLKKTISLVECTNLTEFLADGSGITGVIFANGGKISKAHLPSISSLTAKNLQHLTDLTFESYENITTLSIDNCPTINALSIIESSPNLGRLRLIGINWHLDDDSLVERLSSLAGLDENGYNTVTSVVTGKIHVPVMRERLLAYYAVIWPDLEITYDTLITQFAVTFVNFDDEILETQYVDKGSIPTDPVNRVKDPIPTPTKPSTISTNFIFDGWDSELVPVFATQTIKAEYSESVRKYTIRYVSQNTTLQETVADYNTYVFYTGDTPTYTAEESAYKYCLFSGWDKSGFVDGDKTIRAIYDVCEYGIGYFDGKDLSTLRPVEIYALIKIGLETTFAEEKDHITFTMGNDYSYSDIEMKEIITEKTVFTGTNYIDTGIQLMEQDRDFVLVIDYEIDNDSPSNSVLAQCYQSDGSNGFKLWYNTQPRLTWGTTSSAAAALGKRDVIVLRHIKGENQLHVYKGNLPKETVEYAALNNSRGTIIPSTLVFGCSKADDGAFESHAKGKIYYSKVWYADLGDAACSNLAAWTHESITLEMCGFKRYYLADNSGKRTSMSFLATHLLTNTLALSSSTSNSGGWADTSANKFLNSRFYNAIPTQWKSLIKEVKVNSSIGDKSTEVASSNCYVAIPAAIEIDSSMTSEPYGYEGSPISYITSNETRKRTFEDGTPSAYWLRSPNIGYNTYFLSVDEEGGLYGFNYGLYESGILIEISF